MINAARKTSIKIVVVVAAAAAAAVVVVFCDKSVSELAPEMPLFLV